MERKSSLESRKTKRPSRSDGEGRRKRRRSGAQGNQRCDAEIKMETVIYKLDSRDKIVLPSADNANADEKLLEYVRGRVEQEGYCRKALRESHTIGKGRKRDRTKTRQQKHYSRQSDSSSEELMTTRGWNRKSKANKHFTRTDRMSTDENDEAGMTYIYEKRNPTVKYERHAALCNCQRHTMEEGAPRMSTSDRLQHDNSALAEHEEAHAETVPSTNKHILRTEPIICEGDEEQMLKCLQTVLKKLCELSSSGGARVEIDVQNLECTPPNQQPSSPQGSHQSYAPEQNTQAYAVQETMPAPALQPAIQQGTVEQSDPPHHLIHEAFSQPQPPTHNGFTYPSSPTHDFSEPIVTHVLGKQFIIPNAPVQTQAQAQPQKTSDQQYYAQQQPQQQQSVYNNANNALMYLEPYPTELNRLRPKLYGIPQAAAQNGAAQANGTLQQVEDANIVSQQYNRPHDSTNTQQVLSVDRASDRSAISTPLQSPRVTMDPSFPASNLRHSENSRVLNVNERPASGARVGLISYQNGQAPVILPVPQSADCGTPLSCPLPRHPGTPTVTRPITYPVYPHGPKNGLQNISVDNIRFIPNVRVVDYNQVGGSVGSCGCGCVPTTVTPAQNESYEYILMRVRKEKPYCAM